MGSLIIWLHSFMYNFFVFILYSLGVVGWDLLWTDYIWLHIVLLLLSIYSVFVVWCNLLLTDYIFLGIVLLLSCIGVASMQLDGIAYYLITLFTYSFIVFIYYLLFHCIVFGTCFKSCIDVCKIVSYAIIYFTLLCV